jgi:hypothetical protein
MMRPILLAPFLVLGLATVGCQRNEHKPVPEVSPVGVAAGAGAEHPMGVGSGAASGPWQATALGRDLDRICNVVAYAGVADKPADEQLMATLEWLPRNIESEAGKDFLASIANLDGNAKADALDAGAHRVGLKDCPIAGRWRQ